MNAQPSGDSRLKWFRASPNVEQLVALDGGTVGTVVFLPTSRTFQASTHRKYLGSKFAHLIDARNAVELQFHTEEETGLCSSS
jgi:hypothetical protein